MKTAKQWITEKFVLGADTKDDLTNLIAEIQCDALAEAEQICREYVTNGSTVSVSRDCANIIKQKRVAALPARRPGRGAQNQH